MNLPLQRRAALSAVFFVGLLGAEAAAAQAQEGYWTGDPGKTELISEIMARQAAKTESSEPVRVLRRGLSPRLKAAAPVNQAEPLTALQPLVNSGKGPLLAQTVGLSFLGATLLDAPLFPPDSNGAVGPTQFLLTINGRIRSFLKTGLADGALNADLDVFFASQIGAASTSDPRTRFDRQSGRWFISAITTDTPNRILIAVSSVATLTGAASFTFFSFQQDLVGTTPNTDTGGIADFDTLGIDTNSLYIGATIFNAAGTAIIGSTGFVVRKSTLLTGTLTVVAFRQLCTALGAGPTTPQGVDNDDPAATEGYFIGADNQVFSLLSIVRITNPGGAVVPTLRDKVALVVPTTRFPINPTPQGSTKPLDGIDDRLASSRIYKGSLWTMHNIEVTNAGVAGAGGRNACRWYEIRNLATTPTLSQSGTLFDSTATARSFWMSSGAVSGQGHLIIGTNAASSTERANIALSGRLQNDPAGATQAPLTAVTSLFNYNAGASGGIYRWGDYSFTSVDPNDDMTIWTVQEYVDATNRWAVRILRVDAPPPATPASCNPACVNSGLGSVTVQLSGSTSGAPGFFDPGAGFLNRISASVTGGVVVTSVAYTSPTLITLTLDTTAAAAGTHSITVVNPDGQSATSATPILQVAGCAGGGVTAVNNGPLCTGDTLQLTVTTLAGATYAWTGPNGFTSTQQNPTIASVTAAAAGTYNVTATQGMTVNMGSTVVAVNPLPASPVASSNSPITAGQTLTLTASAVPGATGYVWIGPNGFSSNQQIPTGFIATTLDAGTYSVIATMSGCSSSTAGTTVVVVNAPPKVVQHETAGFVGCGQTGLEFLLPLAAVLGWRRRRPTSLRRSEF